MKNILFKKLLPGIQENIFLKKYTTFQIGGKVKYFFIAKTKTELIKAVLMAKKNRLPFFILGGGSNLLVSDKGYKGLVIKIQNTKFKIQNENSKCKIFAGAGCSLIKLVQESIKNNLTGLEWAMGIPGTIGGAIYGNAGAFKKSMADATKTVEVLDILNSKIRKLKNRECDFDYRNSIFKQNSNLVILSVELQLQKEKKLEIKKRMKKFLDYRRKTQPLKFSSAGSIFKNPPGKSAGELIEKCGLKGKKIGRVKISEKHGNFIVNLGKGKASDVKKLINLIKRKVKNKFGIQLE